jgi:hypothetical protein
MSVLDLKKNRMSVLSGWCTYLGRDSIRRLAASRPCTYTTWLCASTRQHSRELKLISHKGTYGVASNWSMHKAICQFIRSIKRTLLQLSFVGHWGVKDQCRAVSKKPTWYIFSLGILVWAMNRELVQHDGILLCLGDSAGSKQTFKIWMPGRWWPAQMALQRPATGMRREIGKSNRVVESGSAVVFVFFY